MTPVRGLWPRLRRAADRLAVYLPVVLMGLVALGSYWLVRNTPALLPPRVAAPPTHDPDYFMRRFSVRNFDATGRLTSEVFGTEARHYPDTDTYEIDEPRIRAYNEKGELTVATARRALSNADASEVQLIDDAVVTREAMRDASGRERPRLQIRGEFLHAFLNTEEVRSHKPVVLLRGRDEFRGNSLAYDNVERVLQLEGDVHGVLQPGAAAAPQ